MTPAQRLVLDNHRYKQLCLLHAELSHRWSMEVTRRAEETEETRLYDQKIGRIIQRLQKRVLSGIRPKRSR